MWSHGAKEEGGGSSSDGGDGAGWRSVEDERGSQEEGDAGSCLQYFTRHEDDDDETGGMDVMDAFEDFNIRAQKRMQELLEATERKLFDLFNNEDADTPDEMPAYTYMSDHVRLSKPPQFQHWQSAFQYLQVTGSAMLSEPSEDHICLIPGVRHSCTSRSDVEQPESSSSTRSRMSSEPLIVSGRQCLTTPDEDNKANEEIIEAYGSMEEILLQDFRDDDHDQSDGESVVSQGKQNSGCVSPCTTQMLEVVDALTVDCFSTTVAPLMTSFFQVLLQKHQTMIRTQREAVEAAAKRTVEERLAAEQAERIREQRRVVEEAERAATIAKTEEEEAIREVERQELLRQQQREENDDEEVKIRTLAYSHTREWYQPNKKCFSHRGRQLTYLKPVLTTKEEDESGGAEQLREQDPSPARKPSKKSFSVPQKPSRAHPGSLKASSKGVLIRQQQRHPSSHSRSPPRSRSQQSQQRECNEEEREDEPSKDTRLRLPLIRGPWSGTTTEDGRTSFSRRCLDGSDDGFVDNSAMVHSSRPDNVYGASPYRIPSPASAELAPANTKRHRSTRRPRKTCDIQNPA